LGGTQEDKNRADARLRRRIYKKLREAGYNGTIAWMMLAGVAIGGIPRFNYHFVGPPEPPDYGDD